MELMGQTNDMDIFKAFDTYCQAALQKCYINLCAHQMWMKVLFSSNLTTGTVCRHHKWIKSIFTIVRNT